MNYFIRILCNICIVLIIYTANSKNVFASWQGSNEVVSGTWGNESDKFGLESGDTVAYDRFPNLLVVLKNGDIVIGDWVNIRTAVYSNTGSFKKIVAWTKKPLPEPGHWTYDIPEYNFAPVVVGFNSVGDVWTRSDNTYFLQDIVGNDLNKTTTRPLELGVWQEKLVRVNGENKYKVTVKFPDLNYPEKTTSWVIVGNGAFPNYQRDIQGNLYGIGETGVARFDNKGNEIARLLIPKNQYNTISPGGGGFEAKIEIIAEYGHPVLDIHGNVYCWMRTPTNYKILKWTWSSGQ